MASRRLNLRLLRLSQFREFLRTLRLISSRAGHAPFLFHLRSKWIMPMNTTTLAQQRDPGERLGSSKEQTGHFRRNTVVSGPTEDANTEKSTGRMAFDKHHCDPQNVAGVLEPSLLPRNSLGGMVSKSRVFRDTASDG